MNKKRKMRTVNLLFCILFIALTVGFFRAGINNVKTFAVAANTKKNEQIQTLVNGTIQLLESFAQKEEIQSPLFSYREKAQLLAEWNHRYGHGFMMVRILDENMCMYNRTTGRVISLADRDYVRNLYSTGEIQVTDAFLSGTGERRINYVIALPVKKDGVVVGALLAAVFAEQVDAYLADDHSENVLVGSELQYMGGIPRSKFGLPVPTVLENERGLSRPMESIMADFSENRSGIFWGNKEYLVQCFAYSPVENCNWTILTEVNIFEIPGNLTVWYVCIAAVLIAARLILKIFLQKSC